MKASSCLSSHKSRKHSLWLQHWQTLHLNIYKCSEDPKLTGISNELQLRQNKFGSTKRNFHDGWENLLEQPETVVLSRAERIAARELRSGEADTSLAAELTIDVM